MSKIAPIPYGDEIDEADGPAVVPLTAEQAQEIRKRNPPLSLWRVLGYQLGAGLLTVALAGLLTGQVPMAWSAGYGALAVLVPSALFARGILRNQAVTQPGGALAGMFIWELVKVVLTIVMLLMAPRLVVQLNWLALLAGFVVTMKASWVAAWFILARKKSVSEI